MAAERTIRIKVDGDGRGLVVTVRTVEKEIERLGLAVDRVNKRFVNAVRGAAKFALAASALSSSTSGLAGLGATLTTATGALVGLPAIVGAGAAALGTLKLGAAGAERAVQGLDDTLVPLKAQISSMFEQGLAPAVDDLNEVIPQLTGGFARIAREMTGVARAAAGTLALPENTRDLNGLLDQTAGFMFGVRRAAGPLTQAFVDIVSVGSEGFTSLGGQLASASFEFAGFISKARESGQLRAFLDNGIAALREMWQTLKDIGAIVRGVFSGISEGAGGIGATFQPAIRAMREFVESTRGQDFLRQIGAALAEIGEAVGGVLAAGLNAVAPIIGPLANTFAALASAASGILVPALTVLAPILEAIGTFMSENEAFVRGLVTVLGGLAVAYLSVQGAIKLVNTSTELWNTVSGVAANKVTGLGTAFAGMGTAARIASLSMGAIGVIASVIGTALSLFSGQSAEAEQQQQALAAASKSVAKVLAEENNLLNERSQAAASAALDEAGLLKVTEDAGLSTKDLTDAYLGNNEARIRLNNQIREHIAALNEEEDAALAAGDANRAADIEREIEHYRGLQTQIDGAIGTRQQETEAIERRRRATEGSTESTRTATDALEAQLTVLQGLIDAQAEAAGLVLSQRDAERNFAEAVAAASEALALNGQTLDINTEAGRANQSALDNVAKSTLGLVDSMVKNKASAEQVTAAMFQGRVSFLAAAQQMGLTTTQANALADQLGLIPGNYTAHVRADTSGARAELGGFSGLLQSIFGRTYTVAVNAIAATAGVVAGGRATGGPVLPGRSYVVGERGPEVFVAPNTGGTIAPNHQLESGAGAGVQVTVLIDGQEFRGLVRSEIRENARSVKRTATSGRSL